MEYILKVSPKGQVTLPKRLRSRLFIQDLLEVEFREDQDIFLAVLSKRKNGMVITFDRSDFKKLDVNFSEP